MPKNYFDITINGAGVVGKVFAALLKNADLKIAVIDNAPIVKPDNNTTFDARVWAITRKSQQILTQAGAWQHLEPDNICPYYKMQVWDKASHSEISFDCRELGATDLGHIIENKYLVAALDKCLATAENVMMLQPDQPVQCTQAAEQLHLTLRSGKEFHTSLLVGADGAKSWVRQLANISVNKTAYHQCALVTTLACKYKHQHIARQAFLANGPLALLPLCNTNYVSIVWSGPLAMIEKLLNMPTAAFVVEVNKALDGKFTLTDIVSKRFAFPLGRQHAQHYVTNNVALIGDAAHSVHPLAGQGLNLGIGDAHALAKVILNAHAKQRDLGSITTLRRYERQQRSANLQMLHLINLIQKAYKQPNSTLRKLGNLGLRVFNQSQTLKKMALSKAMGMAEE